jgi:hypothetical protein
MPEESIVDTSRPNAGRIYDYILGGSHNFEVDRQAAERILQMLPFLTKVMRLQRWCLQDLAVELTKKRGFDAIIDFASGLPTNDHIHYVVPKGTTIIYSDHDPVIVEYAHEILANTPDVYYFQADARHPEELLNRPEVLAILQGRRDVGLAYWGVSGFLTDDEIRHAAQYLHAWAGKRSVWAFNAMGADMDPTDQQAKAVGQLYAQMGSPLFPRALAKYEELLQPWLLDERGFVQLLEWHGFDESEMSQADRQAWGVGGGGYGAYLIK